MTFNIKITREGADKWRVVLFNDVSNLGMAIKATYSECLMYAEKMNDHVKKSK